MSRNRTGWNGILKMSEEDDDPMINMDDIKDDDDQLLDLENSLKEYAKANVYVLLVVIIFISHVFLEISYFTFSFLRYLRSKKGNSICINDFSSNDKILVAVADPGFSPGGGANSQKPIIFLIFCCKLHENERI